MHAASCGAGRCTAKHVPPVHICCNIHTLNTTPVQATCAALVIALSKELSMAGLLNLPSASDAHGALSESELQAAEPYGGWDACQALKGRGTQQAPVCIHILLNVRTHTLKAIVDVTSV
jgi:hypothetical protein